MQPFLFKWRTIICSECGPERSTTRHVLLTLSLHMNPQGGNCFPSTKRLAIETGRSERVICEHLNYAERDGWIEKEICGLSGQGWKRHRYKPLIPEKALTESQHVDEKGTDFFAEGTDFFDKKALTRRQSSSSSSSSNNSSKEYTSDDSVQIGLSSLLLNLILKRNPKFKKPDLGDWAKHIDRAIRLDNRSPDDLQEVIKWCQADRFWQNNILSEEKLRKQFDPLFMQMKGEENGKNRSDRRSRSETDGDQADRAGKYANQHQVVFTEP